DPDTTPNTNLRLATGNLQFGLTGSPKATISVDTGDFYFGYNGSTSNSKVYAGAVEATTFTHGAIKNGIVNVHIVPGRIFTEDYLTVSTLDNLVGVTSLSTVLDFSSVPGSEDRPNLIFFAIPSIPPGAKV